MVTLMKDQYLMIYGLLCAVLAYFNFFGPHWKKYNHYFTRLMICLVGTPLFYLLLAWAQNAFMLKKSEK
jgi:hypothetical protein